MKQINSKLIKNPYFFSLFTKILGVVFGIMYSILNSRFLGAELKGQLSYINSITAITVIVFTFGIHQAYPYYRRQNEENIKNRFVHVTIIAFSLYLVLSSIVSPFVISDKRVFIAVLLTPIMTFTKLITYVVMVEDPNKKNMWELVVEIIEVISLLLLFLFADRNLMWIIYMIAAKNIASAVYFLYHAHSDFRIQRTDFTLLIDCAKFGFLPMLALLMNNLNYRVDILMLGGMVSDSQIGIYAVGVHLAEKLWLISEAVRDVLYSKLTKGRDSQEVNVVLRMCISACLFIVFLIILLGRPFIDICYGSEYSESYWPMIIVLFGTLTMVYYKIIQAYNIVHKKQKLNFIILLVSVLSNIVMNAILIPSLGIYGAAIASLISYTLCSVSFLTEYIKYTKSRIRDVLFLKKEDMILIKKLLIKRK